MTGSNRVWVLMPYCDICRTGSAASDQAPRPGTSDASPSFGSSQRRGNEAAAAAAVASTGPGLSARPSQVCFNISSAGTTTEESQDDDDDDEDKPQTAAPQTAAPPVKTPFRFTMGYQATEEQIDVDAIMDRHQSRASLFSTMNSMNREQSLARLPSMRVSTSTGFVGGLDGGRSMARMSTLKGGASLARMPSMRRIVEVPLIQGDPIRWVGYPSL